MKIKEGGVMDIQNQHELFQKFVCEWQDLEKDDPIFAMRNDKYLHPKMQDDFELWQRVKAQSVPKWISVEEALPPGNILVLAMAQTFSNVFNVYNVMALDEFQESDITHWMPLPDAPQEPADD